jgi:glycosyltransferase involved in cell wall biosynthesis
MINLITPINQLGYGRTGVEICKALSLKTDVALFPIGNVDASLLSLEYYDMLTKCLGNAKFFDKNADCIRIWHQNEMSQFVGKGKHIGFPIFELDTFKPIEKHHLNSCDELFVCSTWAKDVCINNGVNIPVHVIPLGVDTELFKYNQTAKNKNTTFLNIGKWEIRKGHDILIRAFDRAFGPDDNVQLIMCCSNPFLSLEDQKKWEKLYQNPKIRIVPRLPNHSDVAKLMAMCDCGVFPSRAEGWNLEAIEMLSCAKDLIITDYSAHKEFCNEANSYLVKVDEVEPAIDNVWFHGDGNWAKLGDSQIEQIAHYMIEVHKKVQSYEFANCNIQGAMTSHRFKWTHTAEKILEVL